MKTKQLLIFVCSLTLLIGCKVNQKITTKNSQYYPLKKGNTWVYQYYNSKNTLIVEVVDKNIQMNGKSYYKVERTYSWDKKSIDYSRNEDGVHYSYDDKTKAESVVIPKDLKVGKTWKQYDESWEYEILGINESLETPSESYSGLLKIKATQLTNRDTSKSNEYYLYFKGYRKYCCKR